MKRTTVMLPTDLKGRAMRLARERGISFGELVRRALHNAVAEPGPYPDALYADRAVFEGETPADLSADHDRHLVERDE